MKKIVKPTLALPSNEWNFSSLPKVEACAAFWYEYARQSQTIKKLVEQFRGLKFTPAPARYKEIQQHRFYSLIRTLAYQKQYPATAWLDLTHKESLMWIARQQTLGPIEPHAVSILSFPPKDFESVMEDALLPFPSMWREESYANPKTHTSVVVIRINWLGADDQLVDAFKGILSRRPKDYATFAKAEPQRIGPDQVFPFRQPNALKWLGTLRRYEHAGRDLERYWTLVETDENDREDTVIKREVRWANLILSYFNEGTPLKKNYFRSGS